MKRRHEGRAYDVTVLPPSTGTPLSPGPVDPPEAQQPEKPRGVPPPLPQKKRSDSPHFEISLPQIQVRPVILLILLIGVVCWKVVLYIKHLPAPVVIGPALDRTGWKATADTLEFGLSNPQAALDGIVSTHWRGLQRQTSWFAVDMRKIEIIHRVKFSNEEGRYPLGYALYLSSDGMHWGTAIARGNGSGTATTIDLTPSPARFIKVVETENSPGDYWSIDEFNVY